jgi:hypothetical protein
MTTIPFVEPLPPDSGFTSTDPKGSAGAAKPQLHLVPAVLTEQAAAALATGATRYGIRNFRATKVRASTYVSALMRHLDAWREGEDLDPESGLSHLAHVAANVAILLDTAKHGTLEDDRLKQEVK